MSDTDDSEAVESGERHATSPSVDYVDDAGRRHTIDLSSHDYVTQRGQRASRRLPSASATSTAANNTAGGLLTIAARRWRCW